MWSLYFVPAPLLYIWMHHPTFNLAIALLFATLFLLVADFPLLAGVSMTIAINLELALLPLLPVTIVFAMLSIIANSPSAFIVKQVDYIVWKAIFLVINFTLVNCAIWWTYIVKPHTTQFDFSRAKSLLFEELMPLHMDYHGQPLWV